jgi:hypothetical protein
LTVALCITPTLGQSVPSTSTQYFPKSSLDSRGDSLKSNWYSSQLRALEEPSLFDLAKTPSAESYRFLWLRSFNHPIAIRLDPRPDGTSVLTTKVASGEGGFHPGVVDENSSRVLTKNETQTFLSKVDKLGFWQAPNPVNDQGGTDGSQWIIEGVKGGRYHVIDRWTPEKGVARELGMMLAFDLAKMSIPKREIY